MNNICKVNEKVTHEPEITFKIGFIIFHNMNINKEFPLCKFQPKYKFLA